MDSGRRPCRSAFATIRKALNRTGCGGVPTLARADRCMRPASARQRPNRPPKPPEPPAPGRSSRSMSGPVIRWRPPRGPRRTAELDTPRCQGVRRPRRRRPPTPSGRCDAVWSLRRGRPPPSLLRRPDAKLPGTRSQDFATHTAQNHQVAKVGGTTGPKTVHPGPSRTGGNYLTGSRASTVVPLGLGNGYPCGRTLGAGLADQAAAEPDGSGA